MKSVKSSLLLSVLLAAALIAVVPAQDQDGGIHKIKHVIVIMQENRSFDTYFGTFPGADGIPMQNGVPTVCVPDPKTKTCVKPYHDTNNVNVGGPHAQAAATADIDGGKMDGFIVSFRVAQRACKNPDTPGCTNGESPDVMGYHDDHEIPNYWAYAKNFVLQDHMFEPNASWSLPAHLFMVSAWSARCTTQDPMSCRNELQNPSGVRPHRWAKFGVPHKPPDYAWTDLSYLLHAAGVSWKYYVAEGTQPDCDDDAIACRPKPQRAGTPEVWNPLPWFETVREDGQVDNVQTLDHFY